MRAFKQESDLGNLNFWWLLRSLSVVPRGLTLMCLDADFCIFILLGICCALQISNLCLLFNGEYSVIISLRTVFLHPLVFSPEL